MAYSQRKLRQSVLFGDTRSNLITFTNSSGEEVGLETAELFRYWLILGLGEAFCESFL